MKRILILCLLVIGFASAKSQYVNRDGYSIWVGRIGIGTGTSASPLAPNTSTFLQLGDSGSTKSFLPPRVAGNDVITSPIEGMFQYNIWNKKLYYYRDGHWWPLADSSGLIADQNFAMNNLTANSDHTHNYSGFKLKTNNLGELEYTSTLSGSAYSKITDAKPFYNGILFKSSFDGNHESTIGTYNNGGRSIALLDASGTSGAYSSETITPDSIEVNANGGIIRLPNLLHASSADDSAVVWNPTTKRLGHRALSSGNGNVDNIFSSVAEMRTSPVHAKKYPVVFTKTYYGDDDKISGAKYYWDDTCTLADDSCLIIRPNGVSTGAYRYLTDNGQYNLRQLGCKAADGGFDNWYRIQHIINSMKNGEGNIFLPSDSLYYYCTETIVFRNKAIHFSGGARGSKLLFPPSRIGVLVTRSSPGTKDFCVLDNFWIVATGQNGNDGHVGFNSANAKSTDYESDYFYHGLAIQAVTYTDNIHIIGFSGNGLDMRGSISGYGTNVSLSKMSNIAVSQCYGNGIYIGWDDANGITFINPDIRDCSSWGVYDQSFFGNTFKGGGFHNNTLGHVHVNNVNAETNFNGTYFESQGTDNDAVSGARVSVQGGFQGVGWTSTSDAVSVQRGADFNRIYFRKGGGSYEKLGYDKETDGTPYQYWDAGFDSKFKIKNGTSDMNNVARFITSFGGGSMPFTDNVRQLVGWGGNYNYASRNRGLRFATSGVSDQFLGQTFWQVATDTAAANIRSLAYFPGDRIINPNYSGSGAYEWVCVGAGTPGTYTEGLLGSATGTTTITLNGGTNVLRAGDRISINGSDRTIVSIASNLTSITVNSAVGTFSNQPISYISPTWVGISNSAGNASIQFEDEGSNLGTSGTVNEIDFTGAGVTATRASNKVTVAISGGGSAALTSTQVGVGDGSNLLSGSSAFTFSSNNLGVGLTGNNATVTLGNTSTNTVARLTLNTTAGDLASFIQGSSSPSIRYQSGSHAFWTNSAGEAVDINTAGNIIAFFKVGVGGVSPTAYLHLPAGSATANTAPLKFNSGTNLTTAEAGAMEYDGSNFFLSPSTTRKRIPLFTNATPGNGEILIGNGTDFTKANITSSSSTLTVTNGAGTINIETSDRVTKEATVTTSGSTQTTIATITTNSNEVGFLEASVVGIQDDGSDFIAGKKVVRVFNNSGTLGLGTISDVGAATETSAGFSGVTWTFTTSGNDVRVSVTGLASTNINWRVSYKYTREQVFP